MNRFLFNLFNELIKKAGKPVSEIYERFFLTDAMSRGIKAIRKEVLTKPGYGSDASKCRSVV